MRKTYRYRGLSCTIADNETVNFKVEFVSDGNIGHTVINVPGSLDPEIVDAGSTQIGFGKDLRSEMTTAVSDISNLVPQEDTIRIRYLVNDQLLVEHTNPKSETERPYIVLSIKFTS